MKRLALLAVMAMSCAARADAAIISSLAPPWKGQAAPGVGDQSASPIFGEDLVYWSTKFSGVLDVQRSHSLAEIFADIERGNVVTLTSPELLSPARAGDERARGIVFARDIGQLSATSNVLTTVERFDVSFTDGRLRIRFDPVTAADLDGGASEPTPTLVNPEPSSLVLFSLGGAAMLFGMRRKLAPAAVAN